jgi:hypothetical protein
MSYSFSVEDRDYGLDYISNLSVFQIAEDAEIGVPDCSDSPGAELIGGIVSYLQDTVTCLWPSEVSEDCIQEIADSAPDCYTHYLMLQFLDLQGYNFSIPEVEVSTYEEMIRYTMIEISFAIASHLLQEFETAALTHFEDRELQE